MSIKIKSLPKTITTDKNIVKFRSNTNSADYNEFQENIFFDILNMYNSIEQFEDQLKESNELINVENAYSQYNFLQIKNQIIQEKQKNLNLNKDIKTIKLFPYNFKNKDVELNKADINKKYDQANIPSNLKKSKLFLYDEEYDMVTIPDTLKVDIEPAADNIKIFDTDIKNAFSNDKNKAWVRKIIDNKASFVETELIITLPDNIISNRDINSIEISPFPYSTIDILSLEYKLNGNWEQVPGFDTYKNNEKHVDKNMFGNKKEEMIVKNAENIKLCFTKTPMSKIKIKLRQNTYIEENNNRVFYLGFKNFQVSYENVSQKEMNFYAEISFEDSDQKVLSGIMPIFNNGNLLSDQTESKSSLINYEIYGINKDGDWNYVNDSFPISLDQDKYAICVKVLYDEAHEINPSLHCLDVLYYNKKKN